MGFFKGMKEVMEMGMNRLTEADLDEMEANGQDVSELRKKLKEKKEKLDELGKTDLNRVAKYEKTPRDKDTDFFKSIAGKVPFFGKEKYFDKYTNAKIVYPVVVQAVDHLYEPGDDEGAAIVALFARDKKYAKDFEFLNKVADLFIAMRDGKVKVPESCKKLVKDLNDPHSHFTLNIKGETIDESLKGADLCILVSYLSQDKLPNTRIPEDNVIAALYFEHSETNFYLEIINGKFYKA